MPQFSLWLDGKRGGDNEKLVVWQCQSCGALFEIEEDAEKHILTNHESGTLIPKLNQKGHEMWGMLSSLSQGDNNSNIASIHESQRLIRILSSCK